MAVVRCSQGHFFDDSKFPQCPFCGGEGAAVKAGDPGRPEDSGRTVALTPEEAGGPVEHTVSIKASSDARRRVELPADDQKTIGRFSDAKGNDFVTGWLVCVSGPEKGRDYRIHHGFNRVGRSYSMSVMVMDDPHISRDNHCAVVYDDRSNRFYLTPTKGNIVRKNGDLITEPVGLETGDVIAIGESEFEFVAFCREGHIWKED